MSPLAVVPNVSNIAVISSSAAGGGFDIGSGDFGIIYSFASILRSKALAAACVNFIGFGALAAYSIL